MSYLPRLRLDTRIADEDGYPTPEFMQWWDIVCKFVSVFTGQTYTEIAAASVATPASGAQTLFIDTADHKLKRKDSTGTVTIIA